MAFENFEAWIMKNDKVVEIYPTIEHSGIQEDLAKSGIWVVSFEVGIKYAIENDYKVFVVASNRKAILPYIKKAGAELLEVDENFKDYASIYAGAEFDCPIGSIFKKEDAFTNDDEEIWLTPGEFVSLASRHNYSIDLSIPFIFENDENYAGLVEYFKTHLSSRTTILVD